MKKLSLMEVLSGIEDTRRGRSVMYPLHEVLIIMLLAVICGATSYAKVEMFGKSKQAWLKTFLELENGIPDACTFRNVIKEIDTQKLHKIFCEWMKSVVKEVYGVVAIDGKQARRTKDAKKKPLHMVSAFSAEYGLVIGQLACEEKSNEITAIPKLLEMLEIKGCIVTIDAMGTQTEIAKAIRDKEGDYILALKENQKTLYNDVKLYLDDVRQEKKLLESENYYKTVEKGHGRIETRECIISEEISWLHNKSAWKDLHGIGVIYCTIEKNGVVSKQSHYFIYSCVGLNAKQIMKYKRNHWTVENNLHWVLDMAFREDESRARKDNSAENFNVIRQIAFNILKSEKTFKGGITDKQFQCLLDSSYLDTIVMNWLCS
jgi:predicted transposase YbfD/YdcC